MRTILFQGNTVIKQIDLYSHRGILAEVTPFVATKDAEDEDDEDARDEAEVQMGLLLQCTPLALLDDAHADASLEPFEVFWGHEAMCNPIFWWRAVQCVEAMPVLKDIDDLYWGVGRRREPDGPFQREITNVRNAVGEQNYQKIMQHPLPAEIIDLLIRLVDEGHWDFHLPDVSKEIEVGTVEWTRELRRIGVKHPDYVRAYATAWATVLDQYRSYLSSYAEYADLPYNQEQGGPCMAMLGIECGIVACVERGVEKEYGPDIACLLSIIWERITDDGILENLEKRYLRHDTQHPPCVRPTPQERFQETVIWFIERYAPNKEDPLQRREHYLNILREVYDRFEQLPVTNPLVPENG